MKWAANEVVTSRWNSAEAIIHDVWDVLTCILPYSISKKETQVKLSSLLPLVSFWNVSWQILIPMFNSEWVVDLLW